MLKGQNLKEFFLNSHFTKESDKLKFISDRITEKFDRDISIQPYEAYILKFYIKTHNVNRVLEIGTFGGYSTAAMTEALPDNGDIITLESNQKNAEFAEENFKSVGLDSKIKIIVGDAHDSMNDLAEKGEIFDLVFIDAEKKGYLKYLKECEPITKRGSIIIADNIFLNKAVYDESLITPKNKKMVEVMKEFLKQIQNQEKYESIIIPTEEGLSVSVAI